MTELEYFDQPTLDKIEALCDSNSGVDEKERERLSGIMNFLQTKGFLSSAQKREVHRITEKYGCLLKVSINFMTDEVGFLDVKRVSHEEQGVNAPDNPMTKNFR